jgi:peptidase M1-like protein
VLLPALAAAQTSAADFAERLRSAGLDPDECYRVRDLILIKEDVRLYFTEGFLVFGNEVDGRRHSAVFSGEIEGGDGEILVMPPIRSERLSLATFTDSPNLNEHFRLALMIFSDDTAETLAEAVRAQPRIRKSPERGVLLADRFDNTVSNLSRSFGSRLVYDVLGGRPPDEGFFYSAIQGHNTGNFDLVYDPAADEQIQVGQVQFRENQAFFDVWTSFASRSFRNGSRKPVPDGYALTDYRISATLENDLNLTAETKATLTILDRPMRVMYFDISDRVTISEVTIDGQPCEVWQRKALRANLFGGRTGLFLVAAPDYLQPGPHEIHFVQAGEVVRQAGNGVYFVGSRGSWYPHYGMDFAHYDITFRYPEGINMVFTGDVQEDRSEEDGWHITRRKTASPIRLAGFNIGEYKHIRREHEGFAIEVYANTGVEDALTPERSVVLMPRREVQSQRRGGRLPSLTPVTTDAPPPPDPTRRMEQLAEEVADAFEFMTEHFGAPPIKTLMVSPIPGVFGQGFPGLLYVSTLSYLAPEDRPDQARTTYQDYFFSEIIHAHETAHQWWGNTVTAEGYQDGWLMEALANYSALLLLERRQGKEALETVLSQYRTHLLLKNDDGNTVESAGPITWGPRLDSSQSRAYRTITYEKGSWILHMLRRRMGDEQFLRMLGDLCRLHRYKTITIDSFRVHAAKYLPEGSKDPNLEYFFDTWVFDTGLPTFEFATNLRGNAPRVRLTATLRQTGAPDYFGTLVPVDIHLSGGEVQRHWIQSSDEPATLDLTLKTRPERIVFNPGESVLCVMR